MSRFGVIVLPLLLWAAALGRDSFDDWVGATALPPLSLETSEEMLARDGRLLRAFTVSDGRWRLFASLDAIDPLYVEMLVSHEDKRFFGHHGVDVLAAMRASWQAVLNGRIISGGSTLTMQVARLLEDGPTGTWQGKLRQVRVALALERELTKAEILTLYINRTPMGGNLEGVRAATFAYFGKEPRRLTPAESALLVALPQSPESRRPDRYIGNALDARARVLSRAHKNGIIDTDQYKSASLESVFKLNSGFPLHAPHLTERSRKGSGTRHLTLDYELQRKLENLAARAVGNAGNRLSVALMVADYKSGEVLASVGSALYQGDARQGYVDMTRAVRSPGSTLKPLVYGLAFDQGLAHPETLIEDRPRHFGTYAPQNFDGQFRGVVRVRDALRQSLNLPVVALTEALGPSRLLVHLRRAGANPRLPGGRPGLAISLGGLGLTLEDLVSLYAGLANEGKSVELHYERGTVLAKSRRILSQESAWLVANILADVPPPQGAVSRDLAYKTGTSYGHRDAWAIGFDGRHVIGVWLGRADGSSVPGAFGGDLAAPVLFQAFAVLKTKIDRLPPPPPGTLIVSHAQLPQPLRRFEARGSAIIAPTDAPTVTFPPDGARVEAVGGGVFARVQSGLPPFTWLSDGTPVLIETHDRAAFIPLPGKGFVTLSVIDAGGRSSRARIQLVR